jgi:hypothetical protein
MLKIFLEMKIKKPVEKFQRASVKTVSMTGSKIALESALIFS